MWNYTSIEFFNVWSRATQSLQRICAIIVHSCGKVVQLKNWVELSVLVRKKNVYFQLIPKCITYWLVCWNTIDNILDRCGDSCSIHIFYWVRQSFHPICVCPIVLYVGRMLQFSCAHFYVECISFHYVCELNKTVLSLLCNSMLVVYHIRCMYICYAT